MSLLFRLGITNILKPKGINVNKSELSAAITVETGLNKTDSDKAIEGFIAIITQTLGHGDDVVLSGFGTFKTIKRSERQGRNPATGTPVHLAASVTPKFKASKLLKKALN